jgi:hypothetical protein
VDFRASGARDPFQDAVDRYNGASMGPTHDLAKPGAAAIERPSACPDVADVARIIPPAAPSLRRNRGG